MSVVSIEKVSIPQKQKPFRDAYRRRPCILPVDRFFEWKAIKGQKGKQPYPVAMKDGSPFGIEGCGRTGKTDFGRMD
jgi:putative SOS response-associated peptidase YedK